MHFITNGFKCFLKTNSSDLRQRVPLSHGTSACRKDMLPSYESQICQRNLGYLIVSN